MRQAVRASWRPQNSRAVLLFVLRSFYISLGGFALAALASLSARSSPLFRTGQSWVCEVVAVSAGMQSAVASLRPADLRLLVRETAIAMQVLHERADSIRGRLQHPARTP